MRRWRLLPLAVLLAVLVSVRGNIDDFDLGDALETTKKPPPSKKPQPSDFDDRKPGPPTNPKDTGSFDDSDLYDGSLPKGGGDGSDSNASQGAVAGIVSAVVATVIGAVSSFIAYQKKKLCFKQSDEENVNMESHRGAQSEPPVQRTLLEN
ncbi:CD99 antigen isoform X2 [Strix aluco]|uniref:CD99 antigen isoform X2 n=1 Tax=Strix aluco TaxID=111821 RepID=UPI003DA34A3A